MTVDFSLPLPRPSQKRTVLGITTRNVQESLYSLVDWRRLNIGQELVIRHVQRIVEANESRFIATPQISLDYASRQESTFAKRLENEA